MDALRWIQDLPFSVWMRESSWAIFAWLILHMWGLAFAAGAGALVAGRGLGLARSVEPRLFARFVPVMWAGFGLALFSGVLLLMAYPAKALTNPVFYVKFAFLIGAALLTRQTLKGFAALPHAREAIPAATRTAALFVIVMWVGVIVCGNLLKYTHRDLLVY